MVADPDGSRWRLDRNFHDMRVRIQRLDPLGLAWEGEANPAADNEDAREYRRRLRRIIGFADIGSYVSTACIFQGELPTTRPSDELLRLATGGHRDVQRARERLKVAHRELTARRIDPDDTARRSAPARGAGGADRVPAEQLAQAEAAERQRGPVMAERSQADERAATLEAEIELLEAAQGPLAERDALRGGARGRGQPAVPAGADGAGLRAALEEHRAAGAVWREWAAQPLYPDDFLERLARLDSLWRQRTVLSVVCDEREAALRAMGQPTLATAAAGCCSRSRLAAPRWWRWERPSPGSSSWLAGIAGGVAALLARQRRAAAPRRRGPRSGAAPRTAGGRGGRDRGNAGRPPGCRTLTPRPRRTGATGSSGSALRSVVWKRRPNGCTRRSPRRAP